MIQHCETQIYAIHLNAHVVEILALLDKDTAPRGGLGGGVRGTPQKNDATDGWRQQILKANNIGEGSWLGTADNAKKAVQLFFLITVKSYHNSVGHLRGGGEEVHAPCTLPLDPPSWLNKFGPLQLYI